ncbi:hypothetical protein D3C87_954970 [compost metagenome]
MKKLESAHAKLVTILMNRGVSIGVEDTPLGPEIILTDKATGDKFNWTQGPVSKGGNE